MIWTIVGLLWVPCGVLGYAITFADFQCRYRRIADECYRTDLSFAVFVGLAGPIGLVVAFFSSGFAEHGLKWR